jgi:hypothetical protein
MKSLLAIFWLISCLTFSPHSFAQQNCPTVSSVKKWEVISGSKLLAYDNNDQYYFFMSIGALITRSTPQRGGSVTLRFFSNTICRGDTVIVNGDDTTVTGIEGIRR